MYQPGFPTRSPRYWSAHLTVAIYLAGILLFSPLSPLRAQAKKQPANPPEQAFEEVSLNAKDGVIVHATYYPGPEKKTTVPLILIHDWSSNRTELHSLAVYLQKELGHTVIVPDLRGHGTSIRQMGTDRPIDPDRMNAPELKTMFRDIEATKTYLLQRHNEGKLNIEQLGVLGVGFGATLAIDWAVRDWNARSTPTFKNGQDVKALILVSPRQSFKGLNVSPLLKHGSLSQIAVLTIVGKQDTDHYADAKKIFKAFETAHRGGSQDAARMYEADSALQGVDLIYDRELKVPDWITGCIKTCLVDRGADLPWMDRTSPK